MKKKFMQVWLSKLLVLVLLISTIPALGAGEGVYVEPNDASGISLYDEVSAFRELLYGNNGFVGFAPMSSGKQVKIVDDSRIIHVPQKPVEKPLFTPLSIDIRKTKDFELNEQRDFNLTDADGKPVVAKATMLASGAHSYVWLVDNTNIKGNPGAVDAARAQVIANKFDAIYISMTAAFAPHKGVPVKDSWGDPHGDIGEDGKVSILLYDIERNISSGGGYVAGFFNPADYWPTSSYSRGNHLDMFHMDIGIGKGYNSLISLNPEAFYSTLAHEFQHMLFNMYVGVHQVGTREEQNNNIVRPCHYEYTWFNESLSELAGAMYTDPALEIILTSRLFDAMPNSYAGSYDYNDFLNWSGDLKSYGMSMLHSIYHYRLNVNTSYASGVYNTFRNTANKDSFKTTNLPSDVMIGRAIKNGAGSPFSTLNDADAFAKSYIMFMESFAADGGLVVKETTESTNKFHEYNHPDTNLWGIRQAHTPLPPLANGGAISLTGYGKSGPSAGIAKGASHEMMYKLNGTGNFLKISIPSNSANAMYYAVVPDDINGNDGARVHPIVPGTDNYIEANGKPTYLFVSTLFRNVNTSVTYSWVTAIPTKVTAVDITGVTAAEGAATPSTVIDNDYAEFEAALVWSPNDNPFKWNTNYTATITLTAKEGFTFSGDYMSTPAIAGFKINGSIAPTWVSNTGNQLTFTVTYNIGAQPVIPVITTTSLPDGILDHPYTGGNLTATGSGTILWDHDGNLPIGLSLDMNTGVISGTPTVEEEREVEFTATNIAGAGKKKLTITIASGASLTVNAGAGGTTEGNDTARYPVGEAIEITAVPDEGYNFSSWTVSGVTTSVSTDSLSFTMPANAVTVTANFSLIPPPPPPPAPPSSTPSVGGAASSPGMSQLITVGNLTNSSSVLLREMIKDIQEAGIGDTISYNLKGRSGIAASILRVMSGRDVNAVFNMGTYSWTINGKEVEKIPANLRSIDLRMRRITNHNLRKMAGGNVAAMMLLSHKGSFPFTADLTLNVGKKFGGEELFLYAFDPETNTLEYLSAGFVDDDGNVTVTFTSSQAARYVLTTNPPSGHDAPPADEPAAE